MLHRADAELALLAHVHGLLSASARHHVLHRADAELALLKGVTSHGRRLRTAARHRVLHRARAKFTHLRHGRGASVLSAGTFHHVLDRAGAKLPFALRVLRQGRRLRAGAIHHVRHRTDAKLAAAGGQREGIGLAGQQEHRRESEHHGAIPTKRSRTHHRHSGTKRKILHRVVPCGPFCGERVRRGRGAGERLS